MNAMKLLNYFMFYFSCLIFEMYKTQFSFYDTFYFYL